MPAAEGEVDVKSKALADLEAVPTLSPNDVIELERHEWVMLDMQSSLNLTCGWIVLELVLSFFSASSFVLMFGDQQSIL